MIGLILLFFLNFGDYVPLMKGGKSIQWKKKSTAQIWRNDEHVLGKERKAISIIFVFLIRS